MIRIERHLKEYVCSWVSYDRVNWAQIAETFKVKKATDRLPLLLLLLLFVKFNCM